LRSGGGGGGRTQRRGVRKLRGRERLLRLTRQGALVGPKSQPTNPSRQVVSPKKSANGHETCADRTHRQSQETRHRQRESCHVVWTHRFFRRTSRNTNSICGGLLLSVFDSLRSDEIRSLRIDCNEEEVRPLPCSKKATSCRCVDPHPTLQRDQIDLRSNLLKTTPNHFRLTKTCLRCRKTSPIWASTRIRPIRSRS
jgi:hypothetical protein